MSAKMPWFRMYTDFLNDPKMIALAFEDQRHFIGILALKSDDALDAVVEESLMDRIVAQRLWIDHGIIRDVKKRLVNAGLIDTAWQPLAWDKRQFKSDSSKDRVARFRARNKEESSGFEDGNGDETLQKRPSNAVDTDTDTDKEEAKASLSASSQPPDMDEPDDGVPPCPFDSLIDSYEAALPVLPTVRRSLFAKGANGKAMRARWRWVMTAKHERGERRGERLATTAEEGRAWFKRYFDYVADSDFLTGKNGKFQSCDLGWLVTAANFEKVLSGKYHHEQREVAHA